MSERATQIESVLRQLALGPEIVVPLARQLPAEIAKRRPAPGVWSAHEHACHLPAVEPLMRGRLELMVSQPSLVIQSYEPSRDEPDDALLAVELDEAMDRFIRLRRETIDRLRDLEPNQWDIRAGHAEYADYSVFIMYRHLALHDLHHAYRIEARMLKMEWDEAASDSP
ncbi:MAG: DinB family protein [Planctomycetales bacterium]|nr:DinB family protein [Planctomycetales bacterium]